MNFLIDRVSELYRKHSAELSELKKEQWELAKWEQEFNDTHGENVTFAEADRILGRICELDRQIPVKEAYVSGISEVRELLFTILEFETEVLK